MKHQMKISFKHREAQKHLTHNLECIKIALILLRLRTTNLIVVSEEQKVSIDQDGLN